MDPDRLRDCLRENKVARLPPDNNLLTDKHMHKDCQTKGKNL